MKKIQLSILLLGFALGGYTLAHAQDKTQLIKTYINTNYQGQFLKPGLDNFLIDNVDPSESLGGDVVKIQQTYNGIPVFNAVGTTLIKNNNIDYFTADLVKNFNSVAASTPALSASNILDKILGEIGGSSSDYALRSFEQADEDLKLTMKSRLTYFLTDHNDLRLAYEVQIPQKSSSNLWLMVVDAQNGNILSRQNLTLACNFHDADSEGEAHSIVEHQNQNAALSVLAADNASYQVLPFPVEAPIFGSRATLANPWIAAASPDGWHSDGTTSYLITRGNNVYAYEDFNAINSPGYSPNGGASRNFVFPYNINSTYLLNRDAAITNLFYVNNKMHDIFFQFGFNEAAKNFQKKNYVTTGGANDPVNAEAQDGGGLNNADFSTPANGSSPRMQMYLWSPAYIQRLYYNAPLSAVPRQPVTYVAQFGPELTATGVTGDVKATNVVDGCTALTANSMTGKIGLVQRGTCNFAVKVKNIQNAGGIGAIVYNNSTGALGNMGGTDATVTIPSVLITEAEGAYINALLTAGTTVNVTLKDDEDSYIYRDGSMDSGVVIHEYGHGISNRMTGTGYNCLNTSVSTEQMGEGWSDFFALMLTNQPNATAAVARGIGNFVISQPTTGAGIRPAKYSPDFTINNYTYGDTTSMSYTDSSGNLKIDVHSVGFVWASILWDLHWRYAEKYGYSSDVMANTTNGSSRVLQLVVDALKLQSCNPSFIDGRNALLAADVAKTGGEDKCLIWKAFAKRGVGLNASAGAKNDISDQVENFDLPADCALATDEVKNISNEMSLYPNPAKNEFYINMPSKVAGKLKVEVYDASGKLVMDDNKVSPENKISVSIPNLANGLYMVKVTGLGVNFSSKLLVKK